MNSLSSYPLHSDHICQCVLPHKTYHYMLLYNRIMVIQALRFSFLSYKKSGMCRRDKSSNSPTLSTAASHGGHIYAILRLPGSSNEPPWAILSSLPQLPNASQPLLPTAYNDVSSNISPLPLGIINMVIVLRAFILIVCLGCCRLNKLSTNSCLLNTSRSSIFSHIINFTGILN